MQEHRANEPDTGRRQDRSRAIGTGKGAARALVAFLAAVPIAAGLAGFSSHAGEAAEPSAFTWQIPAWLPPPPVPVDNRMTAAKVELGRHLFYDARLSVDGTVACSTCHEQALAFTDARTVAEGVHGFLGHRNAMGLANVGYFPALTWANPNIGSLEFQALIPIFGEEPIEMGMVGREDRLFERLAADPVYERLFAAAFPDRDGRVGLFTLTRALAAFQRTLISADSAYDRFKYGGEPDALSPAAKRGEELFFSHRLECYHCHQGFAFTDTFRTARGAFDEVAFHNTGLYNIGGTGAYPAGGEGLATFTGCAEHVGAFRTPSLRNVGVTAPYFHDGSAATLDDVVDHYEAAGRTIDDGPHAGIGARNPNKNPLVVGFALSERERADLIAFLESLTDEAFLTNPAFSDPWPADHPARATRRSSLPDPPF